MKKIIAGLLVFFVGSSFVTSCTKAEPETSQTTGTTETTVAQPDYTLAEAVTRASFGGADYNAARNEYTNADAITYTVSLQAGVTSYDWEYSYTVSIDGNEIAAENDVALTSTSIVVNIECDDKFDAGHLTVTVTDANGGEISTGECDVIVTSIVTDADISGFSATAGEPVVLPGTDIEILFPSDYTPLEDPGRLRGLRQVGQMMAYFKSEDNTYVMIDYLDDSSPDSDYARRMVNNTTRLLTQRLQTSGIVEYGPDSYEFTIDGETYYVSYFYSFELEEFDNDRLFYAVYAFGDEDTTYCLSTESRIHPGEEIDPATCLAEPNEIVFGQR